MDTYSWNSPESAATSKSILQTPPSAVASQIDPQNPFENTLENAAYRTDYRRTLPQILLPGFQVPLFPEREERCAIRKSMNTAGLGIFLSCLLTQTLFVVFMLLILILMGGSPMDYFHGGASDAMMYFQNSSIFIALNGLVFSVLNVTVALLGCRRMRIPMHSLFQTQKFTAGKAIQYMTIGIALQCIAGFVYWIISWAMAENGVEMAEVDFSYFSSAKSTIAVAMYTCILAPVTEELLFRGFLMKALSKVGIRFGIVVSALLFGLMHGNISQFLLGFLVGLFLGKIDVRHNSLIPSILVHAAINTTSFMMSLSNEVLTGAIHDMIIMILTLGYYAVSLVGVIFWFLMERKHPLPYPTQKQITRNRVFWSSPWLLATIVLQLGILILNETAV